VGHASLTGLNPHQLNSTIKGMRSHAMDLALYVEFFFCKGAHKTIQIHLRLQKKTIYHSATVKYMHQLDNIIKKKHKLLMPLQSITATKTITEITGQLSVKSVNFHSTLAPDIPTPACDASYAPDSTTSEQPTTNIINITNIIRLSSSLLRTRQFYLKHCAIIGNLVLVVVHWS